MDEQNTLSLLQHSDVKPFITGKENWSFLQDVSVDFDVVDYVRQSWNLCHLISTHAPSFNITGAGYAFQARFPNESKTKPDIVLMSAFLKHPLSLNVCLEYSFSGCSHIDAFKSHYSEYKITRFLEKQNFSYDAHLLREVKPLLDTSDSKAIKGISYWKPYQHQEEIIRDLKTLEMYVR